SYKVLPHAFTVADEGMSMLGAAIEGDYRGAMGTAVSVAVEPSATAAAASVFGAIGTGVGATVGSFIPVVGTAGGAMVGGAIGTVAGGYISSFAYDKYVKDHVGKGVEAGLAGLFDDTRLHEAMMARDAFLRDQGADDLKAAWSQLRMVSKDFNPAGVELVGPGSTPYIVPPKPALPDPQQQAALTTGNVLAGVRKFSIGPQMWDINGDVATHRMEYPGVTHTVLTARGIISVNRIEGTMTWVHRNDDGRCGYVVRETAPFTLVFGPEAVAGEIKPGPVEVLSTKGPCKSGWDKMTRGSSFTAPWHKVE
ncbi:MAG: hypothetical protein Q8M26_17645, partial [Pseudolabrys sp.]|nr:hypothetical protein [Pseudolabrys sp.]